MNITSSENGGMIYYNNDSCQVTVKKGERFALKVLAVDQLNHTLYATVNTYLSKNAGILVEGQKSFNIESKCTHLSFTIYSPKHNEELVLYADGPCRDLGISPLKIRVNFNPCLCPEGFEHLKSIQDRCVCVCHNVLLSLPFIKDTGNETMLSLYNKE